MATFLMTWNPDEFDWETLADDVAAVQGGERPTMRDVSGWSVGVRKQGIGPGDRFFMLRQGREPRGIMASGSVESEVQEFPHWNDSSRRQRCVDVSFETLVDPEDEPDRVIPTNELIERFQGRFYFTRVQSSGQQLPDDVAEELESWWRETYGEPTGEADPGRLAEELPNDQVYVEGAVRQIVINAHERNPAARRACIDHHGTVCCVCDFDFGAVYGDLGRGFVHVHHLKPLSEIGEEYELDPIADLCPICPNCHAMIHRPEEMLTIKQLRKIVKQRRHRRRKRG